MINRCWFLFLLFCCCLQAEWVVKIDNTTLYEKDFYLFVSKRDWGTIQSPEQKEKVFWDFVKQEASCLYALEKGLDHSLAVHKKLKSRFSRLLVNEYYMRHFLGSVVPKEKLLFCQNNLKKQVLVKHILLKKYCQRDFFIDLWLLWPRL